MISFVMKSIPMLEIKEIIPVVMVTIHMSVFFADDPSYSEMNIRSAPKRAKEKKSKKLGAPEIRARPK